MNENENKSNNIYRKLQKARVLLQEKNLKKTGKNKFSGFDYYELSDFLPTVNELFDDIGLTSIFSLKRDNAVLTIINMDDTEETQDFESPTAELELKGCNKIQALGGVHTYLKRYLYMNALEIVENDMFDSVAGKPEQQAQQPKTKANVTPIKKEQPQPQTQTQTQAINDNDFDIIINVATFNDMANLTKYYKANIDKTNDKEAFKEACSRRKDYILDKLAKERAKETK